MALSRIRTIALMGLEGHLVDVEVNISEGLPSYTLLGLPDTALSESRERVRSALVNSGYTWPNRRVTVSLSPAWLPKKGSHFDLPIAIALLVATGEVSQDVCENKIFLGELGLDGSLRFIRGVLPSLLSAGKHSFSCAIIPQSNSDESALVRSIKSVTGSSLSSVVGFLLTGEQESESSPSSSISTNTNPLNLSDVAGQSLAREALEIAAIGSHHLLFIGPPGAGKTMLAERIPTILPQLDNERALQVNAIHSVAGVLHERGVLSTVPPFIAPHHTTTATAMIGGGAHLVRPGAISLAHQGVLFIDEAPECNPGVLDALRQPLESGEVTISRAAGTTIYPAKFLLVLAANPCPCGRYSGKGRGCTCSSMQIRRYLQKLSGPLLDRVDIRTFVEAPTRAELVSENLAETSEVVRRRVIAARNAAQERFKDCPWNMNSEIPPKELRVRFKAEKSGMTFLHNELESERLSARGFHKILRLAWSIADKRGHFIPSREDVEAAYRLREGMELFR